MGDLANKQISQTYDALIQTGTDNPIDGTLRPLQDGSGNNLPVEVSTTGVNFTGTVSGIDTGVQSVVAGTNVTVDNTDPANPIISAAGGGGGAATNSFMDAYKPANMNGWDSTAYFFTSRPMHGGLAWNNLNDQGPGSIQMGWLFVEPGKTISEICLPLRRITDNITYEFGIYDMYDSGSPRDLIVSETISVAVADNVGGNQYKVVTLSTPFVPTLGAYYFAVRCTQSNTPLEYDNTIAVMSRSEVSLNVVNISADGYSVNNVYQSGVIQTNVGGPLPATFDINHTYFEREEQLILLFR